MLPSYLTQGESVRMSVYPTEIFSFVYNKIINNELHRWSQNVLLFGIEIRQSSEFLQNTDDQVMYTPRENVLNIFRSFGLVLYKLLLPKSTNITNYVLFKYRLLLNAKLFRHSIFWIIEHILDWKLGHEVSYDLFANNNTSTKFPLY